MATGFRDGSLLGGRYRLERILGTGGMATVWLAHDERLRRPVAVKIISDTLAADPSYVRRFRREARVAAGLSHRNLVMVYDFGSDDDRPFLAMEYVGGGTLADRIAAGTADTLDPHRLARELLEALDHIHRAGIVHRDVKPANVLIAPDGPAKLTDFGIAQPEDATRLTTTGLVVGTRSYIAPEVARGEPATRRSDLYSCAVVLREAIGPLPSDLADLIARLGEEDPGRRPECASRALAMLGPTAASGAASAGTATAPTEALADEQTAGTIPIAARPGRPPHGRTRTLRAPPAIAGAIALVAALIVLGVILLSGSDGTSSTGDSPGRQSPDGGAQPAQEPGAREEQAAPSERPKQAGNSGTGNRSKKSPGKGKGKGKARGKD